MGSRRFASSGDWLDKAPWKDIDTLFCLPVAVYLIPETLRATVFGGIAVGDRVNVEIETQTQAIVDTTERVVAAYLARTAAASKA